MKTIKGLLTIFALTITFAAAAAAQTFLTALDGSRVDLDNQRGKIVVLAVGAAWLPLSAKQADYTNMLVKKYAGKDVIFYFVATDSTNVKSKNFRETEDIRKFASANKLGVTVLRDSDGAITLKKYSIDQVPSFLILDKNGKRVGEPFGGIDPKYDITVPISKAIDRIL